MSENKLTEYMLICLWHDNRKSTASNDSNFGEPGDSTFHSEFDAMMCIKRAEWMLGAVSALTANRARPYLHLLFRWTKRKGPMRTIRRTPSAGPPHQSKGIFTFHYEPRTLYRLGFNSTHHIFIIHFTNGTVYSHTAHCAYVSRGDKANDLCCRCCRMRWTSVG